MRRYDERVEVRVQPAGPVAFLWRDRVYVVREVLGCWRERAAWWSGPDRGDGIRERRIWRVEAGSCRPGTTSAGGGVFDLAESVPVTAAAAARSTGEGWVLRRALD